MAETLKLPGSQHLPREPSPPARAKFPPALVVLSGERVGVRASVQGNVVIGREEGATLVLPDPGVSSRHAILQDRGGDFALVDLGSTNGTFVNGSRIAEETVLHNGDK